MKIDELDLIEDVHQIKLKNKEEIIQAILKKAEESEYDVIQLLIYGLQKIGQLVNWKSP